MQSNKRITQWYDEYLMSIWKSLNAPVRRAKEYTVEDFDGNEYLESSRHLGDDNRLVTDLVDVTPGDLQKSFICNSRTEAVEGAVNLPARQQGGCHPRDGYPRLNDRESLTYW